MKAALAALALVSLLPVSARAGAPAKPIACAFDQLSESERDTLGKAVLDAVNQGAGPAGYEKPILANAEKCPPFSDAAALPDSLWAQYTDQERTAVFEKYGDPAIFERKPISTLWTQPGPVRDRLFAAVTGRYLPPDEGRMVMFGLVGLAGQAATESAW